LARERKRSVTDARRSQRSCHGGGTGNRLRHRKGANAGIISKGPLEQIDLSHWQRLISVNVTSVFMLTKSILPGMMKRRWGRIINIASVAGQMGGGLLGNSCYAATKGAVIAFTKGVAQEAGPAGVTCNVLCPSFIETDMTASMPEDKRKTILASIPIGRSGQARRSGGSSSVSCLK
jgi:3-oxoacyl-[acyl-carrier protein] reductase